MTQLYFYQVDMSKVKFDTIKPWIAKKVTELMGGIEDDVLFEYVFNQLEDKVIDALFILLLVRKLVF